MRNILIISSILLGLISCSSGSSGGGGGGGGGGSNVGLNGTWKTVCIDVGIGTGIATLTINDNNASTEVTFYSDSACTAVTMIGTETVSLTFGNDITVDGSVAGITTATKLDSIVVTTDAIFGSFVGEEFFDIFTIKGDKLYLGDSEGANDGSTAALRPTQLSGEEEFVFTKQ